MSGKKRGRCHPKEKPGLSEDALDKVSGGMIPPPPVAYPAPSPHGGGQTSGDDAGTASGTTSGHVGGHLHFPLK